MPGDAIPLRELQRRLQDPDADVALLKRYVRLDLARSGAFRPRIEVDPANVLADLDMPWPGGGLSEIERLKRQRRYRARIDGGWTGRRLVSEGDSWFQYPVLLRDVIDQLEPDNAIHCLAGAGDTLENVVRQAELAAAIAEHRPHAVLLSMGGNDLLGGLRLAGFLRRFEPGLPVNAYLTPQFSQFLSLELMPRYRRLLATIRLVDPVVPVLVHSYAYAVPTAMPWLGLPLIWLGILDPGLQAAVVRLLVDRFHAALVALAHEPASGPLRVVDCRDAVGTGWFDELHPNNSGFARVADRFRAALP